MGAAILSIVRRSSQRANQLALVVLAMALLFGCSLRSGPTDSPAQPTASAAPSPTTLPAELLVPGSYRFAPARSDLRILVYRAGPLAQLGHNHVIEARAIDGRVELARDPERASFWLRVTVSELVVDDPAARERSGPDFTAATDPEGIAGTRANMLGPQVLAAARWPAIRLEGQLRRGPIENPLLDIAIGIREVTRQRRHPVEVRALTDGGMLISGRLSVRQSDFGMTPVTALDGGLRVRDRVDLVFALVAVPESDTQEAPGRRRGG